MKTNPVVHFEMPAEDRERMSGFYTKAFGWQTKQLGPEMGEYVLVTTTEVDEKMIRLWICLKENVAWYYLSSFCT